MTRNRTQIIVKIPVGSATLSGVSLTSGSIRSCEIEVLNTLPLHRAAYIKHDVENYLKLNSARFGRIANRNVPAFPSIAKIATPIYIISVIDNIRNHIAYIGQAASATNRFVSGHSVMMKLHHPQYKGYDKYVSFAVIYVRAGPTQIPVEWITPNSARKQLIDHIEHSLIWKFTPPLNTRLKRYAPKGFDFEINFSGDNNHWFKVNPVRINATKKPIHQVGPDHKSW